MTSHGTGHSWREPITCLKIDGVCRQIHLTRNFSHTPCHMCSHHIVAQGVSVRVSFHPHAIHDVTCLSVRWSFLVSFSPVSLLLPPLLFLILPVLCPALHPQCCHRRGLNPLRTRRMRSIAPWRYTILSQVMSPTSSTTSTTQRLLQRSSRMDPATLIRSLRTRAMRYLLFIQEREEPANRRQAYHSHEESLLPAQSFFAHKYGETSIRT